MSNEYIAKEPLRIVGPVQPPNTIGFYSGNTREIFRIQIEPEPRVILSEGIDWDTASKTFWNGVFGLMNHPKPFPEIEDGRE